MLFNSYLFLVVFLPVVLAGYYFVFSKMSRYVACAWLLVCSYVFYAWWNPSYILLLLLSTLVNYYAALAIKRYRKRSRGRLAKWILVAGVCFNVGLLAYFKYANFFVDNLNLLLANDINFEKIFLPLAISFFTFQQIAYLVDVHSGRKAEKNLIVYALFVVFFPQLIAGPIVSHREMIPQFKRSHRRYLWSRYFVVGLSFFAFGLFKKACLADYLATIVDPFYATSARATFFDAWHVSLCYALQIYFDFSGYCDMAIGLAFMFGYKLPINFDSPYKSKDIFEYWQRWHMTLARFMRRHVFVPLSRASLLKGRLQTCLIITVLLSGLWHGASWTFVVWGGVNGLYMLINHYWRLIRRYFKWNHWVKNKAYIVACIGLVFLSGVVSRVLFRAEDMGQATDILWLLVAPFWFNYASGDAGQFLWSFGLANPSWFESTVVIVSLLIVFFCPNTQQIFRNQSMCLDPYGDIKPRRSAKSRKRVDAATNRSWFEFQLSLGWAVLVSLLLVMGIVCMGYEQPFIYFQF